MTELNYSALHDFERLHALGMDAKNRCDHIGAHRYFQRADDLAKSYGDERRRLLALNPAARALWSSKKFAASHEILGTAIEIASSLGLRDELGIAYSNMGRAAAVEIVSEEPTNLALSLSEGAVPHFKTAHRFLEDHSHLYYRYANDGHGSVISALAHDDFAKLLIEDGELIKDMVSGPEYGGEVPSEVSPRTIGQLALAGTLMSSASVTLDPNLLRKAIEQIR